MYRRHVRARFRLYKRRFWRLVLHTLLHADDPPHKLAMGVAIGVFVTFTPAVGLQMGLVVFLAWLMGANKVVGLPIVWLSNPATFVPIYYPCYYLGRTLLGLPGTGRRWWLELTAPPEGFWNSVRFYWSRIIEIAAPLWLGGVLIGLACAAPSYYATYYLINVYRRHRVGLSND